MQDVTGRRRAEQARRVSELQRAEISRMEEMDAFRRRFINNAAHELRTPLTPIATQLYVLKKQANDDENGRSIQLIERNIARLQTLVDDLLDAARAQTDEVEIERSQLDMQTLIEQGVDAMRDSFEEKGLEMIVHVDGLGQVEGDPHRLMQVFSNMLSNALKFTDTGSITVVGRQTGTHVQVSVKDTGRGIHPDKIASLFRAFSQAHDTMDVKEAGAGLGLYISKSIMDAHGGTIEIHSDGLGKGTEVVFSLPVAAMPSPTTASSSPDAEVGPGRN